MPAFRFLLPPGPPTREGGAAYLANLQAALAQAGHALHGAGAPADAVTVIDGLFLPDADPALIPGACAIIHHPAALAAGPEHARATAAEAERLPLLRHIVTTSTPVRDRLLKDHALDPARVTAIPPGVPDVPRTPA